MPVQAITIKKKGITFTIHGKITPAFRIILILNGYGIHGRGCSGYYGIKPTTCFGDGR
jgi:hypothetical protein